MPFFCGVDCMKEVAGCSLRTHEMPPNYTTRYRVVREIGEGTFGQVFEAIRIHDGTVVALKKIRIKKAGFGVPKAVVREIHAHQQLEHDHILRMHDYFGTGSAVVMALEYMHTDLYRVMATLHRPFYESEIKCIMQMLLSGLAAIHASNIIHRVKTHNRETFLL